eukprot:m.188574 g.188574  ORF g.188574 m.188574 type:complete len:225 (+) comp39388_c0_seq3:41-715(+)
MLSGLRRLQSLGCFLGHTNIAEVSWKLHTSARATKNVRLLCSTESEEYHDACPRISQYIQSRLNDPNRFQRISQRKDTSLMPLAVIKDIYNYKYAIQHKGCGVLKGHEDLTIFQQMLSHVRPGTVIELGTFNGGTALWMADVVNMLNVPAKVYSMNIDPTLLDSNARRFAPSNLTFLQGSTLDLEKAFPSSFLSACDRPLILVEDSYNNLLGILNYFHSFLQTI